MLYGTRDERAVIDSLITDGRRGQSWVLPLLGDAGVGKLALLDDASGPAGRRARSLVVGQAWPSLAMTLVLFMFSDTCCPTGQMTDSRMPTPT